MNHTSPSYEQAMSEPIRRIDVGDRQGRGNPPASRYHPAEVAKVKRSTPLPIDYADEGPGLLMTRWFYAAVAFNVIAWGSVAVYRWLM